MWCTCKLDWCRLILPFPQSNGPLTDNFISFSVYIKMVWFCLDVCICNNSCICDESAINVQYIQCKCHMGRNFSMISVSYYAYANCDNMSTIFYYSDNSLYVKQTRVTWPWLYLQIWITFVLHLHLLIWLVTFVSAHAGTDEMCVHACRKQFLLVIRMI